MKNYKITMKLIVTILCVGVYSYALQAGEPPIRMQFVTSDYKGVCSNGKSVLCYGSNGVITRSTDKGDTWHRAEVNFGYTINAMDTLNGQYYGVSDRSILHSTDDGMTWKLYPMDEGGIDITHFKDTIFILTTKGVRICTPSTLDSPKNLYSLDSLIDHSELIISPDGNLVQWIEDFAFVSTYRRSDSTYTSTNVVSKFPPCPYCTQLRHLQRHGTILYVVIVDDRGRSSTERSLQDVYYELVRSTDDGVTWTLFAKDISGIKYSAGGQMMNLTVINDSQAVALQCISGSRFESLRENNILLPHYIKISSSRQVEVLNPTDTIPSKYARVSNQRIVEVLQLDAQTFIAVGNNHCILRSTTGGTSWEYMSYFPIFTPHLQTYKSTDPSTLYIISSLGEFFTTRNGGVTIVPRKYQFYPELLTIFEIFAHFDSTGKGCVIVDNENEQDTNVFITNDFGATFTPYYNLEHYHSHTGAGFYTKKLINNRVEQTISTKNIFYLYGTPTRMDTVLHVQTEPFVAVLRLRKKDYRFMDTTRLPLKDVATMIAVGDTVFIVGEVTSGSSSTSISEVVYPTYAMYRSTNEGESWDSVSVHLPVTIGVMKFSSTYYSISNSFEPRMLMGNTLIFYLNSNTILRYNIQQNVCDTINLNFSAAGGIFYENTMFKYKNQNVGLTFWNTIAHTTDIAASWDTTQVRTIIEGFNDDYRLRGFVTNSTDSGFVVMSGPNGKINLARYVLTNSKPVSVESGEHSSYIWNTQPYPQPTTGIISTDVYWEKKFKQEDVNVMITDILGNQIIGASVELNLIDTNIARLHANMTGQPTGVYMILLRIGSGVRSIPIVVL